MIYETCLFFSKVRAIVGNSVQPKSPMVAVSASTVTGFELCDNLQHTIALNLTASSLLLQVDDNAAETFKFPATNLFGAVSLTSQRVVVGGLQGSVLCFIQQSTSAIFHLSSILRFSFYKHLLFHLDCLFGFNEPGTCGIQIYYAIHSPSVASTFSSRNNKLETIVNKLKTFHTACQERQVIAWTPLGTLLIQFQQSNQSLDLT